MAATFTHALALGAFATLGIAGATAVAVARQPAAAGIYTEAQATRGDALYAENCAQCHRPDLAGGDLGPALTGAAFVPRWTGKPLVELFDYMRTAMPLNSPGGLNAQQNADLLAFLLKKSGYAAGSVDLPASSEKLAGVKLPPR